MTEATKKVTVSKPFHLRTIIESGSTRYLNIGRILPKDWMACKVYVAGESDTVYILRLVKIT